MNQEQAPPFPWQTLLLLTVGVAAAVIIALLLAQIDTFQRRSAVPANGPPVLDLEGTIAAGQLDTIYLPSEVTPTSTVLSTPAATPTDSGVSEVTPEVTPESSPEKSYSTCESASDIEAAYIVQPGETIASIAASFDLSEEILLEANCLDIDQVIAGQKIFIPQEHFSDQFPGACDPPLHWKPHRVRPGDTLPKLARANGTTPYHIMKANCLDQVQLGTDSEIFLPDQILYPTGSK